ncbi:MAG: hypothetical protein CMJ64_13105 [Planctomycetaceae bacterium]|jgi:hypothetical protein|nr:hypothetical protein [Planctomycetaceae bacterium]
MARHEQDREDLMREATALVRRVEVALPDQAGTCVIGFRRDGAASVFFGADPVFQFNTQGELRRAFIDGKLVKAELGKLVWLERVRTDTTVQLLRRDFTKTERDAFLAAAQAYLNKLGQYFAKEIDVVSQVPQAEMVSSDVERWLASLADPIAIAERPNVGA